jgi:hypothetical protein
MSAMSKNPSVRPSRLAEPIPLIIRNANRVRRLTASSHRKRAEAFVPHFDAWGCLTWYLGAEAEETGLADFAYECWASVVASFLCAMQGLYRAAFFYLRDLMELSFAAFYWQHKNLAPLSVLPSWRRLRTVPREIPCFAEFDRWCKDMRVGTRGFSALAARHDALSREEVHLGSETQRWGDVSPFYKRSAFVSWQDWFGDTSRQLIFMWWLYLAEGLAQHLQDSSLTYVFSFADAHLKLMDKTQREYGKVFRLPHPSPNP